MSTATKHCRRSLHRRVNKKPLSDLHVNRVARLTGADRVNELWRRLTGITHGHEPYMDGKERKAGLRRLTAWIECRVKKNRTADERRCTQIIQLR